MTQQTLHGVTLDCVQGNIANQPETDAVANAANAELRVGGGVAGALHRAADRGLEAECRPLAPIRPGEAVITGATACRTATLPGAGLRFGRASGRAAGGEIRRLWIGGSRKRSACEPL
jgi:hypothetical protein